MVTLIKDVSFNNFQPGKKIRHNKTDFSVPMLYNNAPFIFQTGLCTMCIGIQCFTNPHETKTSYSMSVETPAEKDPTTNKHKSDLTEFIRCFEEAVIHYVPPGVIENEKKNWVFESCIRSGKSDTDANHLRLKINSKPNKDDPNEADLEFEYYVGNNSRISSVERTHKEAKKIIRHKVKACFQIELRKLWYSMDKKGVMKFGSSFVLHAIKIPTTGFISEPTEETK